jgi:hypothetical protein
VDEVLNEDTALLGMQRSGLIKAEQGAEEKGLLLAQAGLAFRVYKAKHLSLKQGIDSH